MDGITAQASQTTSPFADPPLRARQLVAGFSTKAGDILALQLISTLDQPSRLFAYTNTWPADQASWAEPRALALGKALPSPVSTLIAPVQLPGAGNAPDILGFALERGGCAAVIGDEIRLLSGSPDGLATALGAGNGLIALALEPVDGVARICITDPAKPGSGWNEPVAEGLACAEWEMVTSLAIFSGHVYAAKANERAGFELWRAPLNGGESWQQVIGRGAWRYAGSPHVSTMTATKDRLYVAVAGADRGALALGDEHPELIAVDPDGTWKLVSGQARFSPDGLIRPQADDGPGTPAYAGYAIGGLFASKGALRLWLRPLMAGLSNAVLMERASDARGWQVSREVQIGAMEPLTLASTATGRWLAAGGGNFHLIDMGAGIQTPLVLAGN